MEWTDTHTIAAIVSLAVLAAVVLVALYGDRAKQRRDNGIGFHFGDLLDIFYIFGSLDGGCSGSDDCDFGD